MVVCTPLVSLTTGLIKQGAITQEKIVRWLREHPSLTSQALADRNLPEGVKYHLAKLKQAGRIRRIGSTKKGRWEVQRDDDDKRQ